LTTLFDVAINHNFGRLHSDISKENRKLTLNDELWSALKFLRTTRQYLEQLGHAIQWGAAEKRAVHQVEEATSAVSAAAATAGDAAFMKGAVGASMEEALQQYLRARIKRQDARNQLAAKGRTVTVRKAMTGWAGALKGERGAKKEEGTPEEYGGRPAACPPKLGLPQGQSRRHIEQR